MLSQEDVRGSTPPPPRKMPPRKARAYRSPAPKRVVETASVEEEDLPLAKRIRVGETSVGVEEEAGEPWVPPPEEEPEYTQEEIMALIREMSPTPSEGEGVRTGGEEMAGGEVQGGEGVAGVEALREKEPQEEERVGREMGVEPGPVEGAGAEGGPQGELGTGGEVGEEAGPGEGAGAEGGAVEEEEEARGAGGTG